MTKKLMDLAAKRRQLPKIKIEDPSSIRFYGPDGEQKTLWDLFEDKRQLILYDFMLYNDEQEGCPGCSFVMDNIPHLSHLNSKETMFAVMAPAPVEKIGSFKERMGWKFPFYSYMNAVADTAGDEKSLTWRPGRGTPPFDNSGLSVFLREGGDVFHTYSTTERGVEGLISTYALLDMTPLGRQETGDGMDFPLHTQY